MSLAKRPKEKKSRKGCWTCKSRKIGCDKGIPHCNNCKRTGRFCEGYGVKLHWPESGDGRRPVHSWENEAHLPEQTFLAFPTRGKYQFLNSNFLDLKIASGYQQECYSTHRYMTSPQRSLKFGYETTLGSRDATLLSYYTEVLSRMITTIDDSLNGFRNYLLPNALADRYLSCLSLRYAILAISAYHLWGTEAAVQYKVSAISFLSQSIQRGDGGLRGQFATCMMLCVGDVFDGADGTDFSLGSRQRQFLSTTFLGAPSANPENKIIIGSLGCSLEVLECISCINELSGLTERQGEFQDFARGLVKQLENAHQISAIMEDDTTGKIDQMKIENTAELYRLGALIYLHSILSVPSDSDIIQDLVSKALAILTRNGVCTSPWPLFIAACEVVSDEQRIQILDVLEDMQSERRIGNLEIVRGIIETVWKQMDLAEGNGASKRVDWRKLVDMRKRIPSFI
ncbi:C6 finger domain-containing protein [Botrytis cinerea]